MCILVAGPKLGNGTEAKQDRQPWAPVIKHNDFVERFQKKIERCHTKNATHLSTLQVRERYAEVIKGDQRYRDTTSQQKLQRLEGKIAAYKHGWSPEFVTTKARLLEVHRILRRKGLCDDAIMDM
jgi:hypothetical protein